MNQMAHFDSIENTITNKALYSKRKQASLIISKRHAYLFISSFAIVLLIAAFTIQRHLASLHNAISSLSQELTALKRLNSTDDKSLHSQLTDMKEMIVSLTETADRRFTSLQDYLKISADNRTYDLRKSYVLTTLKQIRFVHMMLGMHGFQFRLIYRASYDDDNYQVLFDTIAFRKRLLIVVQTQAGAIFGGYTRQKWLNRENHLHVDNSRHDDSFLFNVNREEVYPQASREHVEPKTGILSFGEDFTLVKAFLSSTENYSNFPEGYNLKDQNASENALTDGEKLFQVKELEVYLLQ